MSVLPESLGRLQIVEYYNTTNVEPQNTRSSMSSEAFNTQFIYVPNPPAPLKHQHP